MGVLDWLAPWRNQLPPPEVTAAPVIATYLDQIGDLAPAELWRTQPHLRTVVDFIARQVAQLGLHVYQRDADGGRTRVRDGTLATIVGHPSPDQTTYELVRGLVSDLALYDAAFLLIVADKNTGYQLRPLRPQWVQVVEQTPFAPTLYAVSFPGLPPQKVKAEQIVAFHGWNPVAETRGSSPVSALKSILSEQAEAMVFRQQMWKRGGRIGNYVTRPATAPSMSAEARQKFQRQFNEAWTGDGTRAGGVPFLDEGAELKQSRFNAKEEQWLESTQLSLRTVAAVYHVNPSMVGDTAGISYANVKEFRKMLYGETLGPLLMMIEQRLNLALTRLDARADLYIEFNTEARLRGDAEEQANVLRQGIGAPYMTVNEGRARLNLPAVPTGDELVKPLNVTQDGDTDPIPAEVSGEEAP